jgi:hypothetical protein
MLSMALLVPESCRVPTPGVLLDSLPATVAKRPSQRFCQLSRHEGKAGRMDGSDLGYAAAIIFINWVSCSARAEFYANGFSPTVSKAS